MVFLETETSLLCIGVCFLLVGLNVSSWDASDTVLKECCVSLRINLEFRLLGVAYLLDGWTELAYS